MTRRRRVVNRGTLAKVRLDTTGVATALGISPRKVRRWMRYGAIRGHRRGAVRSTWRVYPTFVSDLMRWASTHGNRRRAVAAALNGMRLAMSQLERGGRTSPPPPPTPHPQKRRAGGETGALARAGDQSARALDGSAGGVSRKGRR